MGRPRKPTKILELTGAFKKNPARALERTAEPQGHADVGDPPEDFLRPHSGTARKCLEIWHRLLAEAPPGCITGSDRTQLANACRLQEQIETSYKVTPAMHARMAKYLADFGMTGPGRAQRGVRPNNNSGDDEEDTGWADFARSAKKA